MQIGEVIRKYRKEKSMTQEEMANRLGVTAPAVNKWENGNSYPDIMLLAPIARLLGITLDTLLAFREDITPEEISDFIREIDNRLSSQSYAEVFEWAKKKIELYPNSEMLMLRVAQFFDARRVLDHIANPEAYDAYLIDCYKRAFNSKDEQMRMTAADGLYCLHFRNGQYQKAEAYLRYFPSADPEKKRKQADIYKKTGQKEAAYKAYEELLFAYYQLIDLILHDLYLLATEEGAQDKARFLNKKQYMAAGLFEMGEYYQAAYELEIATADKDVEATVQTMEKMIKTVERMDDFRKSSLYEHMTFSKPRPELISKIKKLLLECFGDKETYQYLKKDTRWQKLVQ